MNDSGNHSTPYAKKYGLLLFLIVSGLLLAASGLESLRYFRPVTIQTGSHAVRTQKLPDGTVAVLDSGSRLALGGEWKANESREVWLQGGALFTTTAVRDTTGFTIHLSGFDVVAYNQTNVYCFNRKKRMVAWLKEGRAVVVTHDTKPKKLVFLPGNVVEYVHLRFLTRKNANQPSLSPAD